MIQVNRERLTAYTIYFLSLILPNGSPKFLDLSFLGKKKDKRFIYYLNGQVREQVRCFISILDKTDKIHLQIPLIIYKYAFYL